MKIFVVLLSVVAATAASSAVAWPGAIPLSAAVPLQLTQPTQIKTVIPPEISGFAYASSQYINAVPASGYQPQFSYQISLPGYPSYSPVVAASYYPSNNFLYPSLTPIDPGAPAQSPAQPPVQNLPSPPPSESTAGDEDTTIIDSADFSPNQQQQPSGDTSPSPQPQFPSSNAPSFPESSLDSKNMPEYPQVPQKLPSFPPQLLPPGTGFPQFPDIAQFPQLPQFPSLPPFPQLPQFPQEPQQPPSSQEPQFPPSNSPFPQTPSTPPSFPPSDSSDKGQNDEDTVSVDAA